MLSHEMEKLLTFANERQATLRQEAITAALLGQQKRKGGRASTWAQSLRRWWRSLVEGRSAYRLTRRPLVES